MHENNKYANAWDINVYSTVKLLEISWNQIENTAPITPKTISQSQTSIITISSN